MGDVVRQCAIYTKEEWYVSSVLTVMYQSVEIVNLLFVSVDNGRRYESSRSAQTCTRIPSAGPFGSV